MTFLEIILPLPLPGLFTYVIRSLGVDDSFIGRRVIVPFGKRKIYTGIIFNYGDQPGTSQYAFKDILEVLDEQPVINRSQLSFFKWISDYYLCAIGDVYNAAIPSNLKLSSESYVALFSDLGDDYTHLSDREFEVVQYLEQQELSTDELKKVTGLKSPYRIIKSLREKGMIFLYEKVRDKYVPKTEKRIQLNPDLLPKEDLEQITGELESKPKQLDVLLSYLKQVDVFTDMDLNDKGINHKALLEAGVSPSSIKTLIKKGILHEWDQVVDRFSFSDVHIEPMPELSPPQEQALLDISTQFTQKTSVLLQGVTGSGKTEIYIHLIKKVLDKDQQALLLLPEIALTTQIIKRFRRYFGDIFGVYHSRFSDNERAETYQKCLDGKYRFIIGVRSSVFLPFSSLDLIIIDEEHEHSYKQYEPAPRYHARDAAIYLATIHRAHVLLGSATPSLESYHNAMEGKYGYVRLDERFESQPMPEILLVDLVKERRQRKIKGHTTSVLLEEIRQSIDSRKQVILFQNRRGYAPFIQCDHCHHIPKCPNCSVSLTYHIYQNQLICHYCGHKVFNDPHCVACGSDQVRTVGIGTEKIEEELSILLPDIQIKRMDLDTTRSKHSYQRIIDDFEDGTIRMLIGTQMVAKGLDFEHVNLVGIYDVDRLIHFPDFRSHERAFQLITQVSGRAGRKHERGKVVVQTSDPDQQILHMIRNGQQDSFFNSEIEERRKFRYPPFFRLIKVIIRHREKSVAAQAAQQIHLLIRRDLGDERVHLPTEPVIGKIRNLYIFDVLIRLEKQGLNLDAVKQFLQASKDTLVALPTFKSVLIHFDVDPV